jgi:site-specific DNA-methyltransferase (adenine-specific)
MQIRNHIYYRNKIVTIYCADCLEILSKLPSNSIDTVITDPPYGSGGRDGATHLMDTNIMGNRMSLDAFIWFMRFTAKELYRITTNDVHTYVFTDWKRFSNIRTAFESVGWETRSLIVWSKGNGMGEFWRSTHEFILWLTKRKPRKLLHGSCFNVINAAPIRRNRLHPTQKPIEVIYELLNASGGNLILDPFMGTGVTMHAALKQKRKCIGIEIVKNYCVITKNEIVNTLKKKKRNIKVKR